MSADGLSRRLLGSRELSFVAKATESPPRQQGGGGGECSNVMGAPSTRDAGEMQNPGVPSHRRPTRHADARASRMCWKYPPSAKC